MRLTPSDIDPTLVGRIREAERIADEADNNVYRTKSAPGSVAELVMRRGTARMGAVTICAIGTALLFLVLLTFIFQGFGGQISTLLLFAFAAVVALGLFLFAMGTLEGVLERRFAPSLLRAGLAEVGRTRAETLYADAVLTLARTDAANLGGEDAAREILRQLNELMGGAHTVERALADVRTAQGRSPLPELAAEVADLERRAEAAADPHARETLRESADIARVRLEGVRSLAGLTERLEAQEEIVCQTLASVQSALARLRVAPSPAAAGATPVREVTETVARINAQTRAVEMAVQELVGWRGGEG